MSRRVVTKHGYIFNILTPDEAMEKYGIGPHATLSQRQPNLPTASPATSPSPTSPAPPQLEADVSADDGTTDNAADS